MKKITTIFILIFSIFLFSSIANAGQQVLTKENVKKAWAKSATQGEFCRVKTSADDIKTFSGSLQVGNNSDEDKFLANINNLPCTSDLKKIIYGMLQVQRVGMEVPDESLEQLFVIDDVIVRPVQYYSDFYKPGEELDYSTSSNSVYGAVKGIRSSRASLSSPIEGTNLDAGYYVHLDQKGTIDGLYVLYKNDLFRFTQSQKEITDLILVDYTADTKKSESPTSPNETADWKTFEGKGFSMSYPSNWIIDNSFPEQSEAAFKSSDYADDGGMPIITSGFKVRLAMNREVSKNPSKLGIVSSTDVTWLGKKATLTQKNYEGLYYTLQSDSGSSVESSITMVPASEAILEKNKADFLKAANSIILK